MSPSFQSTLPVGGATHDVPQGAGRNLDFNPRSPWGERHLLDFVILPDVAFQSTLPVGGATCSFRRSSEQLGVFQSTLPVGGATFFKSWGRGEQSISIHAPRGGSDKTVKIFYNQIGISIHAPRGGSDKNICILDGSNSNFNPRSPWGERSGSWRECSRSPEHFNPRSPWGERLDSNFKNLKSDIFQSTLPVGGATIPSSTPQTVR